MSDATAGRSCVSCPEMDNPDSYISHLHEALKWHDEHVPRPTNPRGTCVVLEGEKPPEEVMFIGPDGVTHYLPSGTGTCEVEYVNGWMGWHCKSCDTLWMGLRDQKPSYCMRCGKRIEVSE